MRIQTELVQEPDDRTAGPRQTRGSEDRVRIKCRGSMRLPGGTKVSIESREHAGIPKSMPERIDAAYRRLRQEVAPTSASS